MKILSAAGVHRICAVLCIFCMMFVLGTGNHAAYAQDTAKITASSEMDERGETVAISLDLSGNPGIWGLKFKVGYDHKALTLDSVKTGEVFAAGEVTQPESLDKEMYVFYASGDKLENISTDGTVVTMNFVIGKDASAGEYPLTVDVVQAINMAGEEVSIGATNGKITVQEPETEKPSSEESTTKEPTPEEPTSEEATTGETASEPTTSVSDNKVPGNVGTNDKLIAVIMIMLFVACATGFTFAKFYSKGR